MAAVTGLKSQTVPVPGTGTGVSLVCPALTCFRHVFFPLCITIRLDFGRHQLSLAHRQDVPGPGLPELRNLVAWQHSPWAEETVFLA